MVKKPFLQKLKKDAREKLDIKALFPRSEINLNKKLTDYQIKKIKKALADLIIPEGVTGIIYPDKPAHYESAGFIRNGRKIYTTSKNITHVKPFKSRGKYSFYSAQFFTGSTYVVLMPLLELPDFLEKQTALELTMGREYDKVTLREGDRGAWGESKGFEKMFDTCEELLLWLIQYKRKGSLIGAGGSFEYIQVCFIKFK